MNNFEKKILASLIQVNGAAIGSITSETIVELKGGKSNPMKGKVTKRVEGANVMFFTNSNTNSYRNMVQKRLESEGKNPDSFVLGKRVWGERLPDTPFVLHKGAYYIEVIYLRAPKNVTYFLDGQVIEKCNIIGLQETQENPNSQGGLDNKVQIRTYKIESIKEIKMGDLSVTP